jgi:SAM-dependent methyltransferase
VLERPYYERLYALEEQHGWHRGMGAYSRALLAPILRSGHIRRVLDIGCGTGGMLTWLRSIDGIDATGLEYSRDALEFCRKRGHTDLTQASALVLPYREGSFDLVVCTDVLQHLPNPPGGEAALAEARRALRPGGYLFLRTNSGWGEGARLSATYRRYLRGDLVSDVLEAGFEIVRASYANTLPALPTLARRRVRRRGIAHHQHEGHDHSHAQADPGLRLRPRRRRFRWVDATLAGVLSAEATVLGRFGIDLPLGDSLVVLARKPSGPHSDRVGF